MASTLPETEKQKQNRFRFQKKFIDVIIDVEGKKYPCHRIVLASASEYFEKMFNSPFSESRTTAMEEITLNDVDHNTFELILDYIYSGEIDITDNNILALVQTSDYLIISNLETLCINHIRRNTPTFISNIIELLLFALRTDKNRLVEVVTPNIAANFVILLRWEKFKELPFPALSVVLKSEYIRCTSQDDLLKTVFSWVQYDCENRKQYLSQLLELVNFNKISGDYTRLLAQFFLLGKEPRCFETNELATQNCVESKSDEQNLIRLYVLRKDNFNSIVDVLTLRNETWSISRTFKFVQHIPYWKNLVVGKDLYSFIVSGNDGALHMKKNFVSFFQNDADSTILLPETINSSTFDVCVMDREIFIYGRGLNFISDNLSKHLDCFYSYNCDTKKWKALPRPFYNILVPCMTTVNGNIYLLGTNDQPKTVEHSMFRDRMKIFQMYDCSQENWAELPSPESLTYSRALCTHGSKIYIADTPYGEYAINEIIEFDTGALRWESVTNMKHVRTRAKLLSYNDRLWAFGGLWSRGMSYEELTSEFWDTVSEQWEEVKAPETVNKPKMQMILDAVVY